MQELLSSSLLIILISMDAICYQALEKLNVYDILEPCYHDPESATNGSSNLPLSFQKLGKTERPLPVRKRMFGRAWPFRAPVKNGPVTLWPQLMSKMAGNVGCFVSFSSTNCFLIYILKSLISFF